MGKEIIDSFKFDIVTPKLKGQCLCGYQIHYMVLMKLKTKN